MKWTGMRKAAAVVSAAVLAASLGALAGCSGSSDEGPSSSLSAASSASSSAAATPEGSITVHVTMKQDVVSSEAPDSPLQFAEETIDVVAPDGATALEVLQGTDREVKTTGEGDSTEVVAIGALERGADGAGSHWSWTVNDEEQKASPAVVTLSDGDAMVWTFVKE